MQAANSQKSIARRPRYHTQHRAIIKQARSLAAQAKKAEPQAAAVLLRRASNGERKKKRMGPRTLVAR